METTKNSAVFLKAVNEAEYQIQLGIVSCYFTYHGTFRKCYELCRYEYDGDRKIRC